VAEDLVAEGGIDTVSGVQHQILANPTHGGVEDEENTGLRQSR
jgi:hypothetical protein